MEFKVFLQPFVFGTQIDEEPSEAFFNANSVAPWMDQRFLIADLKTDQGGSMRQVVLDTETTGLEPSQGHRIIEIGCVELINRRATGRYYHQYIQPERQVDLGALEVHGITDEFLADKPLFAEIVADFIAFVGESELIIHNAPFDLSFIDAEMLRLDSAWGSTANRVSVLDTLVLARKMHPGQKNNLDVLCKRYNVDNTERELHGALLDARILADVYLAMTGGQTSLSLTSDFESSLSGQHTILRLPVDRPPLRIIRASDHELRAHRKRLEEIDGATESGCVWLQLDKQ